MTDSATNPDAVNDNAPVNDNAAAIEGPTRDLDAELQAALGDPRLENVVGAAMLVATAFRLRDEDALILTLRRLTDAVAFLEEDDVEVRQAACG